MTKMSSHNSDKKITVVLILEMVGRPAEHLITTLKKFIEQIGNEKGIEMVKNKIHDVKPMKDKEGFFTTFAEIEVKANQILSIAMLMFKYMPSHIEVIEPESFVLQNNEWNEILNELTRRLHGYDEVARVIQMENQVMKQRIQEIIDAQKAKKVGKKE
jgi:hypothetical protein